MYAAKALKVLWAHADPFAKLSFHLPLALLKLLANFSVCCQMDQ
ncbi:hypothetical protein VIBNISFn27_510062 [Vibrio nigripulchritudo SFn27]|nr:hypothetical protein VIBNISFn27_510062 [Vibrio nigripulchritudo SFn27]CCN96735.1 hypothetical protein VIBNIENn2_790062 [Vibrio nigripulchritudo ENn2]CCO39144.1 hypothetical protein VIBNISFn135_1100061 [Vibrio nigripulchritudo SFn135]